MYESFGCEKLKLWMVGKGWDPAGKTRSSRRSRTPRAS